MGAQEETGQDSAVRPAYRGAGPPRRQHEAPHQGNMLHETMLDCEQVCFIRERQISYVSGSACSKLLPWSCSSQERRVNVGHQGTLGISLPGCPYDLRFSIAVWEPCTGPTEDLAVPQSWQRKWCHLMHVAIQRHMTHHAVHPVLLSASPEHAVITSVSVSLEWEEVL